MPVGPAPEVDDETSPRGTPGGRPPALLQAELSRRCGHPVRLVLTANRRTWLSYRWPPGEPIALRLSQVFAEADDAVLGAVAAFVRGEDRPRARAILRRYLRERPLTAAPSRRRRPGPERGACHDLGPLLKRVAEAEGLAEPWPTIGWGRRAPPRRRQHIRLGSYDFEGRHITLHPALDQREVPDYVVRQIIHHELLHHIFGVKQVGGRRVIHPPELRSRERAGPDYDAATRWLAQHLPRLLGQRGRRS